jgi:hypothetical protein
MFLKGRSFSCAVASLLLLSSRGGLQADEGFASRLFQQPLQPGRNQVIPEVALASADRSAGAEARYQHASFGTTEVVPCYKPTIYETGSGSPLTSLFIAYQAGARERRPFLEQRKAQC